MMLFGIALSVFAIGFFCWLLFTLAVYALPFFVFMTAALAAFHHGSGLLSSIVIGLLGAAATLGVGHFGLAMTRSLMARACIALLFAIPAAVAGYYATLGVANIAIESAVLSQILAAFGAVIVGGTAWTRIGASARQVAVDHSTSRAGPTSTVARATGN